MAFCLFTEARVRDCLVTQCSYYVYVHKSYAVAYDDFKRIAVRLTQTSGRITIQDRCPILEQIAVLYSFNSIIEPPSPSMLKGISLL